MPKKEINLLPKEEFEKKPLGKLLIWALNVGRWIVIVTELIVILAFLSRFKLDRDIADLYEQIRAKQAVIQAFSSFEEDFRLFQSRLLSIDKLMKNQIKSSEIISVVADATPVEVALTTLSVEKDDLKIVGVSLSEIGLKSFTNSLSQSSLLDQITLSNVTRKLEADAGIKFNLTAKIKNQGEK